MLWSRSMYKKDFSSFILPLPRITHWWHKHFCTVAYLSDVSAWHYLTVFACFSERLKVTSYSDLVKNVLWIAATFASFIFSVKGPITLQLQIKTSSSVWQLWSDLVIHFTALLSHKETLINEGIDLPSLFPSLSLSFSFFCKLHLPHSSFFLFQPQAILCTFL